MVAYTGSAATNTMKKIPSRASKVKPSIFYLGCLLLLPACERPKSDFSVHGVEKANSVVQTRSFPEKAGSEPHPSVQKGEEKGARKEEWSLRGEGTDRVKLLKESTVALTGADLGNWLAEHAMQLSDGDEAFFVSLSSRLVKVPPEKLVQTINATTSPDLRKRLLSAIKEQTSGLMKPTELYALASTLQPADQRNELVLSAISGWLSSDPSLAIESSGQAFDLIKGGNSNSSLAYMTLDPAFSKVPKNRRDEAWSLLPSADQRMRSSIAARIFEGQYKADSLDATGWLDSLPPSKEKSSAVNMLVSLLLVDNDEQSARAWADSASSYLTPGDKRNIEQKLSRNK